MAGLMREATREVPEKGQMRKIRRIVPYWRIISSYSRANSLGRRPVRIFWPSKG